MANAYPVRDQLKGLGYRWSERGKYWYRSLIADGFDIEALCHQKWARADVRIEVYSEDGSLRWSRPLE